MQIIPLYRLPMMAGLPFLALLSACGGAGEIDNGTNNAAGNASTEDANASAPGNDVAPVAAAPVKIDKKTSALEFSYAWPTEAAAIPALDTWLRGNAEKQRADADSAARSDEAGAKKDDYPFRTHSYDEGFVVVANTPSFLVLQSDGYTYTGGAHGMPFNTVIIWDKAAGKRLATTALVDVPAFARAAQKDYCAELDRQREEKRGAPVDPKSDDISGFVTCVDMTKQTVLPISKSGSALDAIRIVIGPYEAGPYAEGRYTIELPMTAARLATVKPEWKGAFTVPASAK